MRKILLASTIAALPAAFANTAPAPAPDTDANKRTAPEMTEVFTITLPTKQSNRGSVSPYKPKFEALTEVGQSFGVKGKTAKQMANIVSAQNRAAKVPLTNPDGTPQYETKKLTDGAGNVTEIPDTTKPKTVSTKHFIVTDVTEEIAKLIEKTPLKGSTVIITRDK
jgi:hypothetical protein